MWHDADLDQWQWRFPPSDKQLYIKEGKQWRFYIPPHGKKRAERPLYAMRLDFEPSNQCNPGNDLQLETTSEPFLLIHP